MGAGPDTDQRSAAVDEKGEVDLPRRDRARIQDPRRLRRREGSGEVCPVLQRGAGVSVAHFRGHGIACHYMHHVLSLGLLPRFLTGIS